MRQEVQPCDGEIRIYPNFRQLRQGGMQRRKEQQMGLRVRRQRGGETEFQRLRPYVAGDPYRHIDWKATARRRSLVSREFGQEKNQNLIFLLDCGRMMSSQSGKLSSFDHALNGALMLAQVALRHGDRVGLLAFDDAVRVWMPPRSGTRTGAQLIRATYDLQPSMREPDYEGAFRHVAARVRRRSLVVLIMNVVDDVAGGLAEQLIGTLSKRHLAMSIWLREPGLDQRINEAPTTDDVRYAQVSAAELLDARQLALARLSRQGALILDVPTEELSSGMLAKYLDIKARHLL